MPILTAENAEITPLIKIRMGGNWDQLLTTELLTKSADIQPSVVN
jgi:hypothetical protein